METKREEEKKESLAIFCLFSVGEMIVDGRRHSRKEVCLLPPAAAAAASNTAIFARYLFCSSAAGGIFKRKTEMAFSHLCKVVLGRKEGRGPQRRLLWQHFYWQKSKHWHVRGRQKKKFRQQAKPTTKVRNMKKLIKLLFLHVHFILNEMDIRTLRGRALNSDHNNPTKGGEQVSDLQPSFSCVKQQRQCGGGGEGRGNGRWPATVSSQRGRRGGGEGEGVASVSLMFSFPPWPKKIWECVHKQSEESEADGKG